MLRSKRLPACSRFWDTLDKDSNIYKSAQEWADFFVLVTVFLISKTANEKEVSVDSFDFSNHAAIKSSNTY
jgi:hypothetical protein